ncbi:MAG: asparagine--tRNA ligase [Planctomycetota bacterium]|nr:MAG: asparagine--tRNA ligase [Planctomycetota bacterium]
MANVSIKDLGKHAGEEVTLRGWLYNKRHKGKLQFILLRDGSGTAQCVAFRGNVGDELFDRLDRLGQESSLTVTGTVKEDKRSPGGYEIDVTGAEIIQESGEYPITPKEHGVDFLLRHRHLWLRSNKQVAVMRIRDRLVRAIREFLADDGFINVDTPIFTPAACEGTTTLFELKYFDEMAYLTQSGQLYNEATAMAHGKVYCFGPTFRAERSKTRKHLTEFWMVEPEVMFADLDDIMELTERFVTAIVKEVLEHCRGELEVLERDVSKLEGIEPPFPRISYTDAVGMLKKGGHNFEWGGDFGAPDETLIGESFERPVLVHRYPKAVKAFYMEPDPDDERIALCVDMIAPEGYGEIIGGGQRTASLEYLEKQIDAHGLPHEAFEWYKDLRRYGSVYHSGFGLGIERTVAWLCGSKHIRECTAFPRMLYKIYP